MFTTALFIVAETWKQPKCSSMNKEDVVHVCLCVCVYTNTEYRERTEYYTAIKKDEILPYTTTRMDLEGTILSDINQRKTIPYEFTYM